MRVNARRILVLINDKMKGIEWYQPLFDLISQEFGFNPTQGDMDEVINTVRKMCAGSSDDLSRGVSDSFSSEMKEKEFAICLKDCVTKDTCQTHGCAVITEKERRQ